MDALAIIPKYEAYKNSGVDWLGDIPDEWTLKPGFIAFSENKRNNKGMKESTVLSLSYGNIVIKPEEKLWIPARWVPQHLPPASPAPYVYHRFR